MVSPVSVRLYANICTPKLIVLFYLIPSLPRKLVPCASYRTIESIGYRFYIKADLHRTQTVRENDESAKKEKITDNLRRTFTSRGILIALTFYFMS